MSFGHYQYQVPYQQTLQQNYPQMFQPTVRRKAELIQGKVAAEAYQVYAGEEVFLIDMDNPCVYRKARGFDNTLEPMETFDLVAQNEKKQETPVFDEDAYMAKIDKRIAEEVDRRLSEFTFKPTTRRKKGDEEE